MQSTIDFIFNNTYTVKANLENELRRFSMNERSYTALEDTLKSLYSLDPALQLAVEYQDEEQDWVCFLGVLLAH